jgi:hypothetical protein
MRMEREIRGVLDSLTGTTAAAGYALRLNRGGHYRIVLQVGAKQQIVFCPSTPGDHRGLDNLRALLKRKLVEMSLAPAAPLDEQEGEPRRRRKRTADAPRPSVADKLWVRQASPEKSMTVPLIARPGDVIARGMIRYTFKAQGGEPMPKTPEQDRRKHRTIEAMHAVGEGTLIDAPPRAGSRVTIISPGQADTPLERLAALEAEVAALKEQLVQAAREIHLLMLDPMPKAQPHTMPKADEEWAAKQAASTTASPVIRCTTCGQVRPCSCLDKPTAPTAPTTPTAQKQSGDGGGDRTKRGSPEWRAKLSEAQREAWAQRRKEEAAAGKTKGPSFAEWRK